MKGLCVGLLFVCVSFSLPTYALMASEFVAFGEGGPGTDSISLAHDVDSSGEVAVGQVSVDGQWKGFRWTFSDGLVVLEGTRSALGVSGNGQVVVGDGLSGSNGFLEPFLWTASAGIQYLGTPPGETLDTFTYASDTSFDGSIVVGATRVAGEYKAFRYSDPGGFQILSDSIPSDSHSASAVSADGEVVVGTDSDLDLAFRWTAETGKVSLEGFASGDWTEATAVSADGEVVVGSINAEDSFLWTESLGMRKLEPSSTPGPYSIDPLYSYALSVTESGKAVVGSSNGTEAYVWTERFGLESLELVLENRFGLGSELAGWRLDEARSVSPDGRFLVGNGLNPDGQSQGWLVRLDQPIYIPEPSTTAILSAGCLAWGLVSRRR